MYLDSRIGCVGKNESKIYLASSAHVGSGCDNKCLLICYSITKIRH